MDGSGCGHTTAIAVARRRDGALLYRVRCAPSDLPPVLARDLEAAWHAAHMAAARGRFGPARYFHFEAASGAAEFALTDRDATAWAAALAARTGLETAYGLSLCLRLLALVDLLARSAEARAHCAIVAGEAAFTPALLRAAAGATLTAEGRLSFMGALDAAPAACMVRS